ncbi:hypothetical protein THAR02_06998 [Trichoderma harzianum]|uniref:DUF676 domain-containing protein n=1 Tax=Trichoderma harzianum TaxID=5544 RepID=A0A0F9X8K3_TRIHA|nr:hypothetical protein THAR02_06998 [Trichoderma harzianum]
MASPPPLPERSVSLPPPPPLPPRDNSQLPPPPPYSAVDESRASLASPDQQGPQILLSKVKVQDPRTSSSQSLVPSSSDSDARRILLLVYIHGFYGNDQSFRSFPAHVHNFLREALSETHAVHSKIYPRYKTYKAIDVARDNFSAWLEPHESPTTDVILIGHSMGGLLAAEMVLMPSQVSSSQRSLKHRILGTLSLDSPFLGLHPGIVASGISSLFQPSPTSPGQGSASPSFPETQSADPQPLSPTLSMNSPLSEPRDPNFDPPFVNDAPFREKSFLTRMMNFSSKHWSEGLLTAFGNHIASHLEFGGCLADYRGLMSRYNQIRALEDVDDLQVLSGGTFNDSHTRVRFANYYTLASGRPKPPSTAEGSRDQSQVDVSTIPVSEDKAEDDINTKLADVTISTTVDEARSSASPTISNPSPPSEEVGLNEPVAAPTSKGEKDINHAGSSTHLAEPEPPVDSNRLSMMSMMSMQEIDPIPMDETEDHFAEQDLETALPVVSDAPSVVTEGSVDEKKTPSDTPLVSPPDIDLPPIPNLHNPPEQPDLSQYTDKDARKQAEKEFGRLQKAYENAVKDRNKALREREKLIEKRQKKVQKDAQKDADKLEKDMKKQKQKAEQEKRRLEKEEEKAGKAEKKRLDKEEEKASKAEKKRMDKEAAAASSSASLAETMEVEAVGKPKKLRKFCNTPSKTDGVMDPTWVSVYMDGMDEVTAHCAVFLPGPHYDKLVGDVASRIVGWVHNDLSVRAMMEMD